MSSTFLTDYLPHGSDGKQSVCNAGDLGSIPGRSFGEGNGYTLHGEAHGQRSLPGYIPWGHIKLDTTEDQHFHFTSLSLLISHWH